MENALREKIITELETMPETELAQILNIIELRKKNVHIHAFYYGRPVVKMEELSKLDLSGYFNDQWDKEKERKRCW
jgi:hypothetical protein